MAAEGGPRIEREGLGIMIDPSNVKSIPSAVQSNILDYSTWIPGNSSATGFSRNGTSAENILELGTGPFGEPAILWAARNNDTTSNDDGGWNGSTFSIDNKSMYRFSVWVNRAVTGNGSFYLGLNGYGSVAGVLTRSGGANSTNPYFWVTGLNSASGWQLVVGHVWPVGSGTGAQHIDSGVYKIGSGKVGGISQDYVWRTETTSARHRSYLYYSTDPATVQLWAYPRVDKLDGNQPTINQLLGGFGVEVVNLANRSQTTTLKNNLRVVNTTAGKAKALRMDGTNDYVKVTGGTSTSLKRTIEMVIKANSQPSSYNPIAVYTNETSIVTGKRTWLGLQNGKFQMHGWGTNDPASTTTISNGVYYHVVYAYDQTTKKHYIWVNGNLENNLTNTEAGMTGWSSSADHYWYIGRDPLAASWTGGAGSHFNGEVALFKTYSKILTDRQVRTNFRSVRRKYGM
jgi:hypothetical protein